MKGHLLMKHFILSAIAFISCAAQADVALHVEFEHTQHDMVRTKSFDCILENNTTHITAEDLDITIHAQDQENGLIELSFVIIYKNEDGSLALISQPVIRVKYNQEATLSIENDNQEIFSLKVIAYSQDAV